MEKWQRLSFNKDKEKQNPSKGKDAAMAYSTILQASMATLLIYSPGLPKKAVKAPPCLDEVLKPVHDKIQALTENFRLGPISPSATAKFERELEQLTRELGRITAQWTYNNLEPDAKEEAPPQVHFEGSIYSRLGKKTPQQVSTLFGNITLNRRGYRAGPKEGEPVLFPLCQTLGIVHSATPALVERIAHYQAECGATQKLTRERLRRQHGVSIGVKRLRQITAFAATAMEEHQLEEQAEQVLRWLEEARTSRGKNRPVLSVGRDGITLGLQVKGYKIFEVATTGTISVYDRRRRRLGTVSLAYIPESGQGTMTAKLTALLEEILRKWQEPLPRLNYVTDAGDNETAYFKNVLRKMRHPRTGERLEWFRVVDYYHASERLWKMAEALFGTGQKSYSWARKMQKLLLKPNGVSRVLHSAGAMRGLMRLKKTKLENYLKAYNYLKTRQKYMRYAEYRRLGLPIGSGVTEAACKTVYTQRLKLSGMRWKYAGAQTILTLRTILLSGVWDKVYEKTLQDPSEVEVPPYEQLHGFATKKAG
jgi:hypothetical protein